MIEVLILVASALVLCALFQISGRLFQIRESLLQIKDKNSEQLAGISWELEKIAEATSQIPSKFDLQEWIMSYHEPEIDPDDPWGGVPLHTKSERQDGET